VGQNNNAMRWSAGGDHHTVSGTSLPATQDSAPSAVQFVLVVLCQILLSMLHVVFDAETRQSTCLQESTASTTSSTPNNGHIDNIGGHLDGRAPRQLMQSRLLHQHRVICVYSSIATAASPVACSDVIEDIREPILPRQSVQRSLFHMRSFLEKSGQRMNRRL